MLLQWNCPSSISPFPIFFLVWNLFPTLETPLQKKNKNSLWLYMCSIFFPEYSAAMSAPLLFKSRDLFFFSTLTRFLSNSITWGRHLEKCVRAHLPRPKFADWLMGGALLLIGTISLFVLVSFWFLWCCFCAVCERFRGGAVKQISSDWRPEH